MKNWWLFNDQRLGAHFAPICLSITTEDPVKQELKTIDKRDYTFCFFFFRSSLLEVLERDTDEFFELEN